MINVQQEGNRRNALFQEQMLNAISNMVMYMQGKDAGISADAERKTYNELKRKYDEITQEKSDLKAEVKALSYDQQTYDARLKAEHHNYCIVKDERDNLGKRHAELEKKYDTLNEEHLKLKETYESQAKKMKPLKDKLKALSDENEQCKKELQPSDRLRQIIRDKNDELTLKDKQYNKAFGDLQSSLTAQSMLSSQIPKLRQENDDLQYALKTSRTECEKYKTQVDKLEAEKKTLEQKLRAQSTTPQK
jgi:chromosome segregation ATPase